MKNLYSSLVFLLLSSVSYGQAEPILDGTVTHFAKILKKAETALFPSFHWLFWSLVTISFAWSFIKWALDESELKSFVSVLTKKVLVIGIMSAAFVYAGTWAGAIIDSFKKLAGIAGNSSLSPSYLFDSALYVFVQIIQGIGLSVNSFVVMNAVGVMIIICYALIAGSMILVLVECQFMAIINMILFSFGGLELTSDFAKASWRYTVALGLKTFFIFLIGSIAETMVADAVILSQKGDLITIISIFGSSMVLALLIFMIPGNVQTIISGVTLTGNLNATKAMTEMASTGGKAAIGGAVLAKETAKYASANSGGGALGFAKQAGVALGRAMMSDFSNKATGNPSSRSGNFAGRMGSEIAKMNQGLSGSKITPTTSQSTSCQSNQGTQGLSSSPSVETLGVNTASTGTSSNSLNQGETSFDSSMAFQETALSEQNASDSVGGFKDQIPKGQTSSQSNDQNKGDR